MTYNGLKELISRCFTIVPSHTEDVSSGIANAIYNPIQYITSCRWFPAVVSKDSMKPLNNIRIGGEPVPLLNNNFYELDISKIPEFYMDIELPMHPDAEEYPYLKQSPFSEYNLFFQPFGNIPIDSSKIYGDSELHIRWSVDYATGMSHLRIMQYAEYVLNQSVIYDAIGEYGVTIPVNGLMVDYKTGLWLSGATLLTKGIEYMMNKHSERNPMNSSLYSNASNAGINMGKSIQPVHTQYKNAAAAGLTALTPYNGGTSEGRITIGNMANGLSWLIDEAQNILGAYMGQVKTVGTSGSFLAYSSVPYVYAYFFDQATRDIAKFGRPLNDVATLRSLSGLCICENAYLNFTNKSPTVEEYNAIVSLLNSGIYVEV